MLTYVAVLNSYKLPDSTLPMGISHGDSVYYLNKGAVSVRVCKKVSLKIHDVSNGRLDRALRAHQNAGGSPHCDQRGRHEPGNKTKKETVDMIKAHINSFPQYKSHYSRNNNPNREFLTPFLTIHMMYGLYKEKCEQDNTRPASEWIYHIVSNEHFNLSFGRNAHACYEHTLMHACTHTLTLINIAYGCVIITLSLQTHTQSQIRYLQSLR